MSPDLSRRRALRVGGVALATAVAGCGGSGKTSTPDPDAGTETYGLLATNETKGEHQLRVTASPAWDDETAFEKRFTLGSEGTKSWDGVLETTQGDDGPQEFAVVAKMDDAVDGEVDFGPKSGWQSGNLWLTPGGESAPDVANVVVTVFETEVNRKQVDGENVHEPHDEPVLSVTAGPRKDDGQDG